jgi:hypothetical protein
VLARPIFHTIIPVGRLRSFPVLPATHTSDGVQASIREKVHSRSHLHRHGVTNQKGIYTVLFPHPYQQVSSIRHSLAPYLYTLYDFISQYTWLDTADLTLEQIHESGSRLALIHLLASKQQFLLLFLFLVLSSNPSERRRGGFRWDFSIITRCTEGPIWLLSSGW